MFRLSLAATLAALAAAVMPVLADGASSRERPSAPRAQVASGAARVMVRHTARGAILVNGRGFTLYTFGRDARNRDRCVRISGCAGVWPLARTHGRPIAGRGVRRSLLGTIRVGAATQITYAGHPLYGYVGDGGPGATAYVGVSAFGGTWRALRASGHQVG